MLRKMFKENMKKVANGEDPIGTVREKHDRIDLPCEKDKFGAEREFARGVDNPRFIPIQPDQAGVAGSA